MDPLDVGRILLGLVLLAVGAELLVRGASALALRMGLSTLVIGLTVVAATTSTPELAVTIQSVFGGEDGLAIGNIVGSNIANVLLILGIAALILPLRAKSQLVRVDIPIMIGISVVMLVLALDGDISALEGLLLLLLFVGHVVLTIWVGRREERRSRAAARAGTDVGSDDIPQLGLPRALLYIVVGVALLVGGANLLVAGAVGIATALGVSGLVVGLTVVAIGTGAPEIVTSVVAAIKGDRDMAIGNVVGSCIVNIGLVLGLPALLAGGIEVARAAVVFDIPIMIASAIAIAPAVITGFWVARWEGGVFVLLYAAYITYVVLNATGHDAREGFALTMVLFVLPLVAVTFAVTLGFELGRRKGQRDVVQHPASRGGTR